MRESPAKELLDLALSRNERIRIECGGYAEARKMRFRCYNVRRDARRESRSLFSPEEDAFNTSPYDGLEILIESGDLVIAPSPKLSEFKITLGDKQ